MFTNTVKIIILLTFQSMLLTAVVPAEGQDTYEKAAGRYRIFAAASDSILVNRLLERIRTPLRTMQSFFDSEPRSVIRIFLTKSGPEYHEQAHMPVPEWSQAIAFTREGRIILNLSTAEAIRTSPAILVHELFHIRLAEEDPEGRVPVWLNEGMAQYVEQAGLTLDDKRRLANALSAGKLMDLAALDSMITFSPERARLAYNMALSAVLYFVREHGPERLRELLRHMLAGNSPDQAFQQAAGYDFIEFEIRWNKYLSDQYRWLVILNFEHVLWVTIGLLFLLALLVKRYRIRRKVRGWEREESDDLDLV